MDLEKSLNEHIAPAEDKSRFIIDDDNKADWALRKIAESKNEIYKISYFADSEINRIEDWERKEKEKYESSIDYFTGLLAEYASQKRKQNSDFKSQSLPAGRIRFKKQQPKWNVDKEKVVKSIKSTGRDDLIRIKEEPSMNDIKKAFIVVDGQAIDEETGQVIEGIKVEDREDKFEVVTECR